MALRIFGPGGPYLPMTECASLYSATGNIEAEVTKGTPRSWIEELRRDGDLVYGGAEYMLVDFDREYPGIIDTGSITNLYPRTVGIMVRPGNPGGISSLKDLSGPGITVLNVELEAMGEIQGRYPGVKDNVTVSVVTGEDGVREWLANRAVDAWITYESWHVKLADESGFVPLAGDDALSRQTPIAVVKAGKKRTDAEAFIAFLKSAGAHRIFREKGWQ